MEPIDGLDSLGPSLTNIEKALLIASSVHAGQTDKADEPYILHAIRVMQRCEDADTKTVAVLHDVVEDSDWTLDQLRSTGFPDHIVEAIDCVTKRDGESYEEFIARTKPNALARAVKLADLQDNMDITRLGITSGDDLSDEDVARLRKYKNAYVTLRQ